MRIVFKIGGSMICPDGVPDVSYVREISNFITGLSRKNKIIVVAGGGRMAKDYIKYTRSFRPSEDLLDCMGILGARMNAMVLIASLGKLAYPKVVKNREDLEHGVSSGKIVVLGGTVPGQTTNAVAVAAAQFFKADMLVILTDVKGIYDKDPKKFRNARMLEKIKAKELYEMVRIKKHTAGPLTVMDSVAASLLVKGGIKTVFLHGKNTKNILNAINKRRFKGTTIE